MLTWGADAATQRAYGKFSPELSLLFLELDSLCCGLLAALLGQQLPLQHFLLVHGPLDMRTTLLVVLHCFHMGFVFDLFDGCFKLLLVLFLEVLDLLLVLVLGLDY